MEGLELIFFVFFKYLQHRNMFQTKVEDFNGILPLLCIDFLQWICSEKLDLSSSSASFKIGVILNLDDAKLNSV